MDAKSKPLSQDELGAMQLWLREQLFLPRWFRDISRQKAIFKMVWGQVERARARDAGARSTYGEMNWISAQCFVLDHFLWFMARHGYTLQPTRAQRGFRFYSAEASLAEFDKEELDALGAFFASQRKGPR